MIRNDHCLTSEYVEILWCCEKVLCTETRACIRICVMRFVVWYAFYHLMLRWVLGKDKCQNVANLLMAWRGSCKDAVFEYFRLVGISSLGYLFLRILSCRK
jgi:cytochrome c oxidase assembly factor CtaG